MRVFLDFLAREPIGVSEALKNLLLTLIAFNVVTMTQDQLVILIAAVSSTLALAARGASTPNIKLPDKAAA